MRIFMNKTWFNCSSNGFIKSDSSNLFIIKHVLNNDYSPYSLDNEQLSVPVILIILGTNSRLPIFKMLANIFQINNISSSVKPRVTKQSWYLNSNKNET